MKGRRWMKMLAALSMAAVLAGCGSGAGEDTPVSAPVEVSSNPAQGEGTESDPVTETPSATASVSTAETTEPVSEFPGKPEVDEADVLYSGEWEGLNWLVSKDGLLVVTGTFLGDETGGNRFGDLWPSVGRSVRNAGGDSIELFKDIITSAYVDVDNVTSFWEMFGGSSIREEGEFSSLQSIDLSNLDTSNVIYMGEMFYDLPSLTSIDLGNFDTSNVVDMRNMFHGCSSLTSLDLSSFDMNPRSSGESINTDNMFSFCVNLTTIYVNSSGLDYFEGLSGISREFSDCGTDHVTLKETTAQAVGAEESTAEPTE